MSVGVLPTAPPCSGLLRMMWLPVAGMTGALVFATVCTNSARPSLNHAGCHGNRKRER